MLLLISVFAAVLGAVALVDAKRACTPEGFLLNGRRSGTVETACSIVASCAGSSATIGLAGLAFTAGMPAVWWLLSGAAGLMVLTTFLTHRIRERGRLTLPELVRNRLGSPAVSLITAVILIAWCAILAAQLLALGVLVESATGFGHLEALAMGAAFVVLYTAAGGQAGVMRSDVVQLLVMGAGLLVVLVSALVQDASPLLTLRPEVLNEAFTLHDWSVFMLLVGGSYVVCPMLFGRMMSAKSTRVARHSGFIAAAGLAAAAFLIMAAGVEARAFVPEGTPPDQVLPALAATLPAPVGTGFVLAMLATILSSADSCLITAAAIAARDVLRSDSVATVRFVAFAFAIPAFLLACEGGGVLSLLLMANAVYVPAVVPPVFAALVTSRPVCKPMITVVIALSATTALAGEAMGIEVMAFAALGLSIAGTVLALVLGREAGDIAPARTTPGD